MMLQSDMMKAVFFSKYVEKKLIYYFRQSRIFYFGSGSIHTITLF